MYLAGGLLKALAQSKSCCCSYLFISLFFFGVGNRGSMCTHGIMVVSLVARFAAPARFAVVGAVGA